MFLWSGVTVAAVAVWLLVSTLSQQDVETHGAESLPQTTVIGKLIREPAVVLVLLMSVGVFLFNHGLNNWLPELLRSGGMTVVEAGYWAAVPTVVGLMGSLLIPRLATPGRRFPILIGLSVSAAAASLLLQFEAVPLLFGGLFLQGIAKSALMTVLILTLVELPGIGERYAGVASGLFFSAAEVGGVLGPVTLGVLYDVTGGFTTGLYMLCFVAIALALGAMRLQRLSSVQARSA